MKLSVAEPASVTAVWDFTVFIMIALCIATIYAPLTRAKYIDAGFEVGRAFGLGSAGHTSTGIEHIGWMMEGTPLMVTVIIVSPGLNFWPHIPHFTKNSTQR
jgi:hypothetical protein